MPPSETQIIQKKNSEKNITFAQKYKLDKPTGVLNLDSENDQLEIMMP